MRVVMFYHSLVSDWNHGNAHFLRGIARELIRNGHDVYIFEPENGWSRSNLVQERGQGVVEAFRRAYPQLESRTYDLGCFDLASALAGADLVLVHEWNDCDLVARIGEHHASNRSYALLFHDTHHRSVTDPSSMAAYDLRHYDGVLAFGDAVRNRYLEEGWASRAWTWHEAADTSIFYPRPAKREGDVVWIGNWGDEERTAELEEFLISPVERLGLRAVLYGVRYTAEALVRLDRAGIEYGGWIPNYEVPDVFARFAATVHIPRRPYIEALPGIPTIRPFEALACAIPLVSAQWTNAAGMFDPGEDFLVAHDGDEMTACLRALIEDGDLRSRLAARGLSTISARHTCAHRVAELMGIVNEVLAPI